MFLKTTANYVYSSCVGWSEIIYSIISTVLHSTSNICKVEIGFGFDFSFQKKIRLGSRLIDFCTVHAVAHSAVAHSAVAHK